MPNLIGTSSPVEPPLLCCAPHQRLTFPFRSPLASLPPSASPFAVPSPFHVLPVGPFRSLCRSVPLSPPVPTPFCWPQHDVLPSAILPAFSSGLKVTVLAIHRTWGSGFLLLMWKRCVSKITQINKFDIFKKSLVLWQFHINHDKIGRIVLSRCTLAENAPPQMYLAII